MVSPDQTQGSYQQSAQQPNLYLSSPTDNDNTNTQVDSPILRLVWHLCHLCNVTTSSISVYLSLEALARETHSHGGLEGSSISYFPVMRAQALMLSDICHNLQTARDAMLRTNLHDSFLRCASYRSLIDAGNKILATIHLIPQMTSPFLDAPKLNEQCMPPKDIVDRIRAACDEVTELCQGNASKGITGWKECWRDVGQQLGRH